MKLGDKMIPQRFTTVRLLQDYNSETQIIDPSLRGVFFILWVVPVDQDPCLREEGRSGVTRSPSEGFPPSPP